MDKEALKKNLLGFGDMFGGHASVSMFTGLIEWIEKLERKIDNLSTTTYKTESCSWCKYYLFTSKNINDWNAEEGICRYRSPYIQGFPIVQKNDWCNDFEPKTYKEGRKQSW